MSTNKEKSIDEMSGDELQAALQAYSSQSSVAAAIMPGGLPADAKPKDIDAAGQVIMNKPNHLLTPADQEYILQESRRVLREGW